MNDNTIDMRVKLCAVRMKNLRKDAGLNQVEFGKQFGVTGPSIARYEIGKRNVPLDLAMEVATKYGVSLEWITGETKNEPSELFALISKLNDEQKGEVEKYARYIIERD